MSPTRLLRPLAALFAVAGFALPEALAQSGGLKGVIDEGLAELARRQHPDGSYGDAVTTADAVLAFVESHRQYAETDGPFVRRAVDWLAARVGPDGRPLAPADAATPPEEVAAVGRWIEAALARSKRPEAIAARERLAAYLASRVAPDAAGARLPDAEFERSFAFDVAPDQLEQATGAMTQVLCSDRSTQRPEEFARWLRAAPSVLRDIAARAPDLTLAMTDGSRAHWAGLFGTILLRATHAPAGFEELPAREIAATARALTICAEHERREATGPSGGPPKPGGTARTLTGDLAADYRAAAGGALDWLAAQQKDGRFGFMGREDAGITALALASIVRTCDRLGRERPQWVASGLDWIVSLQKENGAIHSGGLAVYTTSAALMALTAAGRPADRPAIERAALFLKVVQSDEGEGYDRDADWGYGGIGYGSALRPDLSNTQFGLEALHLAGVPADDEAMQRAILFLQRCQNSPEFNPQPIERGDGLVVVAGRDGGAGYHPGESKAGLLDNGDGTFTARSYGSMTYALLKCYLFAGLPLDDGRVQAALHWIERNWTVDLNPGFDPATAQGAEYQGLFYYWFTMAKALDAAGIDTLTTPDGRTHAWRDELLAKLLSVSFREGFWTNDKSSRWMEEFPVLATAYALAAMDHCQPRGK